MTLPDVTAKDLNMPPERSPPLWTVRTLLVWLVLACLLPGVVGAVILSLYQYQVGRTQLQENTLQTARSMTQTVDAQLVQIELLAQTLTTSDALVRRDFAAFHRRAQALIQQSDSAQSIHVYDVHGQPLVNTRLPFGQPLPKRSNLDQIERVFATGKPVISEVFLSPLTGLPVVSVAVPVFSGTEVVFALGIGIAPQQFQRMLVQQNLPPDWVVGVFDGTGTIAARTHAPEQFVGQKSAPELLRDMLVAPEGILETETLDGIPSRIFYSRSSVTNWGVAIAIPIRNLEVALVRSIVLLGLGIGFLFGIGLGLAWYMGGRISRSVKALTGPAVALEAGQAVVVPLVHFLEAQEVALAMARTARLLVQRTQALRESHAQLQESEERYYAMVEHSPEAITVHQDGKLLYVNPTGVKMIGADTAKELIGRSIFDFVPPDSHQALLDGLNSGGEHGGLIPMFELSLMKLDGTPATAEIQGTSIVYNGKPAFQASLRDITTRKQASEKLRVSDLALKAVSQGVLVTDADGRILSANDAFLSITGFSEAEILGRPCNFVQGPLTDPLTRETIRSALRNATGFSGEILNYRKDGTTFWNELTISPAVNEQGQLTHFVGVIRDVTERTLVMDEIGQHRQHLEELVRSRTDELAHARDVAESASQAKSVFLATMSHELRTPLNAVVGLTGLLADSPLNRRQRDYADKVLLSARALRLIIDDVLDFSKIEAGALQLEQAPFSLNAILSTLAAVVGVSLRDKPIEALFDVPPDIPDALIGDALRLHQILLNLTSNAAKFTEAGTIVVSVRCLARHAERITLQFAVCDTGIGLASDQLTSIFDEFVQAETATSRVYGGTGLGLAISARLAQLMGGQIDVESSPGTGSEFRFSVSFNLGRGESRPVLEERLRSLNILVVDDHPLTRVILTQACVGFGWQATAVDSGAAGLNELRCCAENGRHYDLVLLDWRMPGMDGLDMLRQGHATPGISLPPVVLMTPMFEMEQAVAASDDLHLDGIAAKPMTPANLLDAVKRAYSGEYLSILPAQGKPDRRLAGMRLLVAEDNALNQEVAEEILTRAGAEVVIASNGLAVVEALRKPSARFDAVLMDIQMPLMDGYTATRLIRDELGQTDLSIIAVTAFARPEDREKSRLAGMVGHLVKPLDVEDLLDIVDKTRRSTGVQLAVANQDSLARAMKLGGLDVAAALKVFGSDQKKYVKFLRKFIVQQGGCPNEARRLFDADDLPGAAKILHDLSGMAGMLHATELARLAAVAESGLLKAELDGMLPLLAELQVAMQTLKESVDQIEVLWA